MNIQCWSCRRSIEVGDRIGRTEECPECFVDLHCCEMCSHYETSVSQGCREPQAEFVHKKHKSNFCDFFTVNTGLHSRSNEKDDAMSKLEALFKK